MGGLVMLIESAKELKQKALDIISDYIMYHGKHGYAVITYKDNPNCYVSFTAFDHIPYLEYQTQNACKTIRINGDTIDGIVEIADAIQEYKETIEWIIYPQVSIQVKANSMEKAKEKATQYVIDKGIPKELIIVSNDACFKV